MACPSLPVLIYLFALIYFKQKENYCMKKETLVHCDLMC